MTLVERVRGIPDQADIDAFVEVFRDSDWRAVEVAIGVWSLRLARAPCPVAGIASAITVDVGTTAPAGSHWYAVRAPHIATVRLLPARASGDRIAQGDELCRLEVLRDARPLAADVVGILRRTCVADGNLVEAGQVLFMVEPATGAVNGA